MAQHRRSSKKKLAPTVVLALSIASVGSPLALLFMTEQKATAIPTSSPTPQFAADMPKINAAAVLAKAKRVAPTYTAIPPSTTTTTTKPALKPTPPLTSSKARSTPTDTETTTARQKPTQRATGSSLTAERRTASTSATPRRTSTVATKAAAAPAPTPKTQTPSTATRAKPPSAPSPTTPTKTTTKETPPDPPKALSLPSPSHQLLAQIAQKYVNRGIPYQMGGNSLTGGMDCSHFVWMVLKEAGYSVAYRPSDALASWTQRTANPQPGDLVLFKGHVGIYVSSGMMIDQGSSGGAHLREIKYYNNFIGYGRLPI